MNIDDYKPSGGIILHSTYKRNVIRYGDRVVKSGPDIKPSEAKAMRFIAENTNIPVPKVYDQSNGPIPSITMDYIDGERLDRVWNGLSEEYKLDVAQQLKGILSELRTLKGRYIGSVGHGYAIDGRRFDFEGGPFDTESEFNTFLMKDTMPRTPKILRDFASRSLRTDHEIVFTHGDFAPRNIIINDGRIVGLLDWEYAGWYPEYWEFVKTFNAADHRINWYNYVEYIFPQCYEKEYVNDRFLGSILRH